MYELSTALSYVIPRKKTFSIGIIGLLATIAISAIVWVILVFFSVSEKFEERWAEKIQLILGSVRVEINPTLYRNLPENMIDRLSMNSSYRVRRIKDLSARAPFVWEEGIDEPLSASLHDEHKTVQEGSKNRLALELKNRLLKSGLGVSDFETIVAELSLQTHTQHESSEDTPTNSISQYGYLIGRDSFYLPASNQYTLDITPWDISSSIRYLKLLHQSGNSAPLLFNLYKRAPFQLRGIITEGSLAKESRIDAKAKTPFQATLCSPSSLSSAIDVEIQLLGKETKPGKVPLYKVPLSKFLAFATCTEVVPYEPKGVTDNALIELPLEYIPRAGYPIYLPKQFLQNGVALMSEGTMTLPSQDPTKKSASSKGLPIFVAGFFDTGILSVGGKVAVVSSTAVNSLSNFFPLAKDPFTSSSLIIFSPPEKQLSLVKLTHTAEDVIEKTPQASEIFTLINYRELDTTKDLFQQLSSEKNLFRLISLILLSAASSNIFCMLFILVHTKAKEIAILRALGSSKRSIQAIFTMAGAILGLFGAALGIAAASVTLYFLPQILHTLSSLQGQEVLQSAIYGVIEKETINLNVLLLTLFLTSLTSSLAGWLASLKACRIDISDALRSG